MTTLLEVRTLLERVFNKNTLPLHYEFWRTKDSTELLNAKLLNISLFVPGDSQNSNLISALKRVKNNENSNNLLESYINKSYLITDEDITLLENWVDELNPILKNKSFLDNISSITNETDTRPIDENHVEYWRSIDFFFLPGLASPQTLPHVLNMHAKALENWIPSNITNENPNQWTNFLAQSEITSSFTYVRQHQRRLIQQYYGNSQELLFDSLWKFGGNLLPIDPLSGALPKHTMNGVLDWFYWIPYLDATLRAQDIEEVDHNLAIGWQIGIVADGLLRTDSDRPVGSRMQINDFEANDPNLRENVLNEFKSYDTQELLSKMISRAKDFFQF